MDNESLNQILLNSGNRQFWIKQWGHPDLSSDEGQQSFDFPIITVGFARNPRKVNVGDILIVYRIKVSKIMFVAESVTSPKHATDEELRNNPLFKRWPWSMDVRNLTPTFGTRWNMYSLKPFALADEYSRLNPQDKVRLGSLNFGIGNLRISEGFGKFLIKEILRLSEH